MISLDELKLTDKRKDICNKLGFNSVEDILSYYPFRYDNNYLNKREDYIKGNRVCFKGRIVSKPSMIRIGANKSLIRFKCINQNNDEISCSLFNQPWFTSKYKVNDDIIAIGILDSNNRITLNSYTDISKADTLLGIKPVYLTKANISQNDIKSLINSTLKKVNRELIDYIPLEFKKTHGLIDYKEALYEVHNPKDVITFKKALSRLKYEEFLHFYLALYLNQSFKAKKKPKVFDMDKINELIQTLEFKLTKDQLSTIKEILIDLSSDNVSQRLVQGDVGSGKTIVAMIALYANFLSGYQGAFMAPTEILAKQHYDSLINLLKPFNVKIELLTSSIKNKKEINERLINNDIDIIVGTHALFSENIKMSKLGLVITDEQQRFGVNQRKKLIDKGENVDFILMSATPIPRTLASAIYGDMAISSIYTMPDGRKGSDTYIIGENSILSIKDDLMKILDSGHQIYIIVSAIDKNNMGTVDASSLYEELKDIFLPYKLGLLHGKLDNIEKEEVMKAFYQNDIQILLSTTVVEVGVNVKNATCMVVYNAERFGLSQLHQLRGRIQRSNYRGSFYLLSDSSKENERLEVLAKTNDGFKIAEEDLKLRGPGDLLGTRQSGLPAFILGNLLTDRIFIDAAQNDARKILINQDNIEYKDILDKAYKIAGDTTI